MRIRIVDGSTVLADPSSLTAAELAILETLRGERRRVEWIRGRIALRGLIGDPHTSIVSDPDGAPRAVGGAPVSVSLSHDGDWVAAAVADAAVRIGIDLCLREHMARAARVLSSGRFDIGALDPVIAWAAIEAVLKVRRRSITSTLDGGIVARGSGGEIEVCGIGGPVRAEIRDEPQFVVAWAMAA